MKSAKIAYLISLSPIILGVLMLIGWFAHVGINSTIYTVEYEWAQELNYYELQDFEDKYNSQCEYPDCTQIATQSVSTDHYYTHIMSKGIELMSNMPNKANFQLCSDSFTHTEKNEHTVYDTNTYLVPQGDGSIRIEARTDKYIIHSYGKTNTVNYVYFEGHYCDTHADAAGETWSQEVESAFIDSFGYFFYKNGLWVSIVSAVCLYLLIWRFYFSKISTETGDDQPSQSYDEHATRSVSTNSWTCTCGKVNAAYVSSCSCGKNKRDIQENQKRNVYINRRPAGRSQSGRCFLFENSARTCIHTV